MPIRPLLAGSLTSAILVNPLTLGLAATQTDLPWRLTNPSALNADQDFWHAARPTFQSTVREAEPVWMAIVKENARALSELSAGWDGRGSVAISRKVLYRATSYVESALKDLPDVVSPRLVPGGDGSVQIEWHAKHGELEFDMGPHDEMTIWIRDRRNGAEFAGDNQAALTLFYRWAPWIASRQPNDSDAGSQTPVPVFSIAA
jgi:hypothetical protein